jgi:hypothetical protein
MILPSSPKAAQASHAKFDIAKRSAA